MTTGHFLPVKHFSSAVELLDEARARRARLFQPAPAKKAKPTAVPAPAPVQPQPGVRVIMRLPEFTAEPRAHVDAYRADLRLKITPLRGMFEQVCAERGWDVAKVLSKSRRHALAEKRHELMWLAKEMFPGKSLNEIGAAMGGLDHTTILYGARQHEKRRTEGLK